MHVEWKSLKGIVECGDNYEISNRGEVRNVLTGTMRKPQLCKVRGKGGYFQVKFNKKKYYIHRLVALAFIPNPENKPTVNHISGDHFDNSVDNLEWASHSEQEKHAWDNGIKKVSDKQRAWCAELGKKDRTDRQKESSRKNIERAIKRRAVVQIDSTTGEVIGEFQSVTEASKKTGVCRSTVSEQCRTIGKSYKYNFYFRYK